jgi:hypothetical protein
MRSIASASCDARQKFCHRARAYDLARWHFSRHWASTPYRLAALQPLALLAWYQQLPQDLSNGQVRAALTKVMHRMFDNTTTSNAGGFLTWLLRQPAQFCRMVHQQRLVYMTRSASCLLGLPASAPF